jgi:hypothetical protein
MALPPLELFSLRKELPEFQAALSVSTASFQPSAFTHKPHPCKITSGVADVAQLVEQLIRNQ